MVDRKRLKQSMRLWVRRPCTGMTLLELMIAVLLFGVFLGVFALVSEYVTRFMAERDGDAALPLSATASSQLALSRAMEVWVAYLAQAGIDRSTISSYANGCVEDPVSAWKLPGYSLSDWRNQYGLPAGYQFCLRPTSRVESELSDLIANVPGATPGIYVLVAMPQRTSLATLPERRLFCRPAPFC